MSVQAQTVPIFISDDPLDRPPARKHPLLKALSRWTPSQGWSTMVILVLTLLIVGNSLNSANWVELPGLSWVFVWAALAGMILAKTKAPASLLHAGGLLLGAVVVTWQTSSLIEDESIYVQVPEMWDRLTLWYQAASSGGISTDLLPFTLALLSTAWLLGYAGSWFIFRSNNVWVAVVLAGIVLLTNLSFLPDKFTASFFVFIFLAMLLVARMNAVQRQASWRKDGVKSNPLSGLSSLNASIWFSALVLLIAGLLPLRVIVSETATSIWLVARTPVANIEDQFARLFSGIPSRKDLSGRFFGSTLPFQGKISFGGDVVFWANTSYPSYWLSQTYSEYSPEGWIAGETRSILAGPGTLPPQNGDVLRRIPVTQSLQLSFRTSDFLSGGTIDWISREAVAEALVPKEFEIDILDPTSDSLLPEDVRSIAEQLRGELNRQPGSFVESYVTKRLPGDLVLVGVTPESGAEGRSAIETVTLARKEPVNPEIASVDLADILTADQSYSMVSHVSLATDAELRAASSEYSGFVRDHYLQLPPDLPQRVRDLAVDLTRGAETPLDKVLILQNYLRGPGFAYSQDIEAPPRGADGVDHFLFETQEGYSDYFASSMVVLLRNVGVPARMAAGYAPGEIEADSGRRFVRDTDSHGWVQVYFPRFGWIDFEPTPNWPVYTRPTLGTTPIDLSFSRSTEKDLFAEGEFKGDATEGDAGGGIDKFLDSLPFDPLRLVIPIGITLGALVAIWLVSQVVWNLGLARATPVEKVYTKMSRLGAFAGIGRSDNLTPSEYARTLGDAIPSIATSAQGIAWTFSSDRYGRGEPDEAELDRLQQAWKSVRSSLAARALRRPFPRNGGHQQ